MFFERFIMWNNVNRFDEYNIKNWCFCRIFCSNYGVWWLLKVMKKVYYLVICYYRVYCLIIVICYLVVRFKIKIGLLECEIFYILRKILFLLLKFYSFNMCMY